MDMHVSGYLHTIFLHAWRSVSIHFSHPGSQSLLYHWFQPELAEWSSLKAQRCLEILQPRGKTQTLLHISGTDRANTPPCPGELSGSGLPPLTKESDMAGHFPSTLPCFSGWPLRLGPLDSSSWKTVIRQIQLPLGAQKCNFSFPIDPENPKGHIRAIPGLWG